MGSHRSRLHIMSRSNVCGVCANPEVIGFAPYLERQTTLAVGGNVKLANYVVDGSLDMSKFDFVESRFFRRIVGTNEFAAIARCADTGEVGFYNVTAYVQAQGFGTAIDLGLQDNNVAWW